MTPSSSSMVHSDSLSHSGARGSRRRRRRGGDVFARSSCTQAQITELCSRLASSKASSIECVHDHILGDHVMQALAKDNSCVLFRIKRCVLTKETIKLLWTALSSNSNLNSLEMDACKLEAIPAVQSGGFENIRHLSLWQCGLKSLSAHDNGLLSAPLAGFECLVSLDLSDNGIHASELALALTRLRSLRWLDVCSNGIGLDRVGFDKFCSEVRRHPSLQWLGLAWNEMGNKGAARFADVLRTTSTLVCVDLRWNSIGEQGCESLLKCLKTHQGKSTLRWLKLDALWGFAGSKWIQAIQAQLASNTKSLPSRRAADITCAKFDAQMDVARLRRHKRSINAETNAELESPSADTRKRHESTHHRTSDEIISFLRTENSSLQDRLLYQQCSHAAQVASLRAELESIRAEASTSQQMEGHVSQSTKPKSVLRRSTWWNRLRKKSVAKETAGAIEQAAVPEVVVVRRSSHIRRSGVQVLPSQILG